MKITIEGRKDILMSIHDRWLAPSFSPVKEMPGIRKVIFNDPATIVYWNDGTKTIVKASEFDAFEEDLGLAMAIANKYFNGRKGDFRKVLKKADRIHVEERGPSGILRNVVKGTEEELPPCKYCGGKLVIRHWHEDYLENPDWYDVEHLDLDEAYEKPCPLLTVAYQSVEAALESYNREIEQGSSIVNHKQGKNLRRFVIVECERKFGAYDTFNVLRIANEKELAQQWIEERVKTYELKDADWQWDFAERKYGTYDRYGDWYCLEILDVESV